MLERLGFAQELMYQFAKPLPSPHLLRAGVRGINGPHAVFGIYTYHSSVNDVPTRISMPVNFYGDLRRRLIVSLHRISLSCGLASVFIAVAKSSIQVV